MESSQTTEIDRARVNARPLPPESPRLDSCRYSVKVASLEALHRRLSISSWRRDDRVRLNVPIENVRRIQFDIERDRPATLVIVPDSPSDEA
jgi:hypothetical protein